MTIPQYATACKLSRQAIYQRLNKRHIDKSTLLDAEGQLTEDGLRILDELTGGKSSSPKESASSVDSGKDAVITSQALTIKSLTEQLDLLRSDNERLTAELAEVKEHYKHLEAVQLTLTETVHQLSVDLSQAQTLQAVALPEPHRWRDRVRQLFHKGKQ